MVDTFLNVCDNCHVYDHCECLFYVSGSEMNYACFLCALLRIVVLHSLVTVSFLFPTECINSFAKKVHESVNS